MYHQPEERLARLKARAARLEKQYQALEPEMLACAHEIHALTGKLPE